MFTETPCSLAQQQEKDIVNPKLAFLYEAANTDYLLNVVLTALIENGHLPENWLEIPHADLENLSPQQAIDNGYGVQVLRVLMNTF